MEVNSLHRGTVDLRLSCGDRRERRVRALTNFRRCSRRIDDATDMAEVAAVRLRRDVEVDFLARNAGPAHVCHVRRHPVEPESLRKRCEPLRAQPEIDEGSEGHIPGYAAEGIENGDRHSRKNYPAAAVRC